LQSVLQALPAELWEQLRRLRLLALSVECVWLEQARDFVDFGNLEQQTDVFVAVMNLLPSLLLNHGLA